jgi:EAL domain-containing protein (putative c-di-GMP-specific phosphodiesterase class I)
VLLQAIVNLAHDLGMDVLVKGADAEKDASDAAGLGCDYAQGYAFGQPIGIIDARKLVGAVTLAA